MSSLNRDTLTAQAGVPLPDAHHQVALPIYARVVVGGAGWLSALFLLFWLTLSCANVPSLWLLGGAALALAAVFVRRAPSPELLRDGRNQATFVIAVAARLSIFVGLMNLTDSATRAALMMVPVEALLLLAFPDPAQRFGGTVSACSLLLFAITSPEPLLPDTAVYQVLPREVLGVITAILGAALLFHRHRLERAAASIDAGWHPGQPGGDLTLLTGLVEPVGLGLVTWSLGLEALRVLDRGSSNLIGLVYGVVGVIFVGWLVHRATLRPDQQLGALATAIVFALLGWKVPGLPLAFAFLLLGLQTRLPLLTGLALAFFVVDGALFYYELHTSLAVKGGLLLAGGVVLLLGRLLIGQTDPQRPTIRPPAPRLSRIVIGLATVAPLVLIAGLVALREGQLATGEVVFLQLAPVDPRSLVQGDYMALAYAVDAELPPGDAAVLVRDADGVLRQPRADDGTPIKPDERRVRIEARDADRAGLRWVGRGGSRIATAAYLFQEGHAEQLEGARYGQFVLSGERLILTRLTDAERQPLGPDRPRW